MARMRRFLSSCDANDVPNDAKFRFDPNKPCNNTTGGCSVVVIESNGGEYSTCCNWTEEDVVVVETKASVLGAARNPVRNNKRMILLGAILLCFMTIFIIESVDRCCFRYSVVSTLRSLVIIVGGWKRWSPTAGGVMSIWKINHPSWSGTRRRTSEESN